MITKYGYDTLAVVVLVVVAGSMLSWVFIELKILKYALIALLVLFLVLSLNFFRDPERTTPEDGSAVIAPADGRVVSVGEVHDDEYHRDTVVQVSIFMSPLDVHVNRFPISGTVSHFRYIPGEYLMAFEEKSSARNERTHIGVENDRLKVLFKQIAGFLARRIVAEVKVGDTARAGERFGMIKFGSRVDVLMPRTVRVAVRKGDRTVAGETVLATLN